MTDHGTPIQSDNGADDFAAEEATLGAATLEYHCTEQELEEAGFASGFSVGNIDEMPEKDTEFVPDPADRTAGSAQCSAAGELMEMFPARRFGSLLELVAIFGLDRPLPARRDPCTAL